MIHLNTMSSEDGLVNIYITFSWYSLVYVTFSNWYFLTCPVSRLQPANAIR